MRVLALAILAIGMVSATQQARAQTYDPAYPICMHLVVWGGGYEDCSYYTLNQCQGSASGRGGTCGPNPFYAGAKASMGRNEGRHRRIP
jgi:hypothetical protein